MSRLKSLILGSFGLLVLSTVGASARIVCNDDGDCWHSKTVYTYPPAVHLSVHDDDWRFGDGDRYRWREHEGRGFWHGDKWSEF